ncbi:hypothetical protein GCM10015536_46760 [Streptomyces griseomycini]|nr:hypothetical protein GCM10015536_46760 [Streptomyces griseomycini]
MPIARPPWLTGPDFTCRHLPCDTFLDDAVALGREKPELRGITPRLHFPQAGDAEARDLHRRIEERGLSGRPAACAGHRPVPPGGRAARRTRRRETVADARPGR